MQIGVKFSPIHMLKIIIGNFSLLNLKKIGEWFLEKISHSPIGIIYCTMCKLSIGSVYGLQNNNTGALFSIFTAYFCWLNQTSVPVYQGGQIVMLYNVCTV